jgi:hypothetical protein
MKAIFGLIVGMASVFVVAAAAASEKQVVGWLERALILPGGFTLSAKMDTGADNSSLNALDFTIENRDGQEWVRFKVTDDEGKTHQFEKKLVRIAKIKRHGAARQERPVVMIGICVGKHYREVEVNLVDRRKYKYQLLIGRSFMSGAITVDPSRSYVLEPECRGTPVE